MWFMIKVINPLVSLILRSPLHRIMSKPLLLITYEKHKARKGHTLPVQYALDGYAVYIIPGVPEKKTWWRNLRDGTAVTLTMHGKSVNRTALINIMSKAWAKPLPSP